MSDYTGLPGYRVGYRLGLWLAQRVPEPVVKWYGRRKGWL